MPIYEFVCPDCGWEFEELLRTANEADALHCPACDSQYVLKKISTFAAKISGSGFDSSYSNHASCGSQSNPGGA